MSNFVFSYAKGRWIDKYSLPLGTDNILVVLLQSTGLQADATLGTYQYLSQLTAAGNLEATFTNYTRQVLSGTSITISVNTSTAVTTVSIPTQVWNAAGGATNNTLGALLTCYRPASNSTDASVLLLTKHDFAITTTGGNLTATISSIGTAQ
jgi:hypothetical protein